MTRRPGAGVPPLLHRALARMLPRDEWSREFLDELDEEWAHVVARLGSGWRAAATHSVRVLSPRTVHFVWMVRRRARAARRGTGPTALTVGLGLDVRQAWRGFAREPRSALFIVAALAIGIGSTTAMYAVADRLFLGGPMHVHAAKDLVRVHLRFDEGTPRERAAMWIPYETARAVRDGARAFSGLTLYRPGEALGRIGSDVRPLRMSEVDHAYFTVLGVAPRAGRFFGPEAFEPGSAPAVLSHALAEAAFGSPEAALGASVELEARTVTVVGVAPDGFAGPHLERVDVWLPLDRDEAPTRNWWLVGRLPPAADGSALLASARAEADAVHRRTEPGRSFRWALEGRIELAPLGSDDAGAVPAEVQVARLLLGVVLLVLFIACANVVNLLLARMTVRHGEVVVRVALGVGRWRLARLLLSETLLLALVGGLASLPVAYAVGTGLRTVLLPDLAWTSSPLSGRVLLLTLAGAVAIGVVIGLLPARHAGGADLARGLSTDRLRSAPGARRTQTALATTQVTLAAALLVCAGLFVKSFWTIRVTDLGVDAGRVMAVTLRTIDEDGLDLGSEEELRAYQTALAAVARVPGVEGAALAVGLPFVSSFGVGIHVPGLDSIPQLPGGGPYVAAVTGGYFAAVGTRIVRGSPIDESHVARGDAVVVVSESMATTLWPGQEPLGRCLRPGGEAEECATVVGVAADVHRFGYREPPSMQFYLPLGRHRGFSGLTLVARADRGAHGLEAGVRAAITRAEPAVDHAEVVRLDTLLDPEIRPWRLGAGVLTLAASLALLVSLVGVYGVLSYVVAQRRREIGVRLALGASAESIRGLVLTRGLASGALGVLLGGGAVLAASPWIESLLFETRANDPWVYGGAALLLLGASSLAALLPAARAARTDPVQSLRAEG